MALLLGSRGRGRKSNGLWMFVRGLWQSVAGRSQWRDERPQRLVLTGWVAGGSLLAVFALGYLTGDHFGQRGTPGSAELATKGRVEPGFLDEPEAEKLSSNAFIVGLYVEADAADGKAHSKALAKWLQGKGLAKARPYLAPIAGGATAWTVAVYYDGDAEFAATRGKLIGLPADVPDESFCSLRKSEAVWPRAMAVQ